MLFHLTVIKRPSNKPLAVLAEEFISLMSSGSPRENHHLDTAVMKDAGKMGEKNQQINSNDNPGTTRGSGQVNSPSEAGTRTPTFDHNKKVSFNPNKFNVNSFPNSSNESSDLEDGENYHDQEDDERKNQLKNFNLKKLASYPYGSEKMLRTKSGDSQLSDSSSYLPEFNKRPLTDTPVVSSVTSPDLNSEDYDDLSSDLNHELKHASENANSNRDDKQIAKLKNISHLNLADLNKSNNSSSSLSPLATKESTPAPQPQPPQVQITHPPKEPSQLAKPQPDGQTGSQPDSQPDSQKQQRHEEHEQKPKVDGTEATDPGFEIPLHLQKKFEKSASLEKLKTLLNTKPKLKKAYTLNIPGQTSSKISPDGRIASVDVGSKLVIVMVGLPARGKSYITNKLTRYLNWLQHDCRVFNVGNTRRMDTKNNNGPEDKPLPDSNTPNNETNSPNTQAEGGESKSSPTSNPKSPHNADFFSPDNITYTGLREKWAMDTLDQLLDYVLDGSGSVGIFDATNSTKNRRLRVLKRIQQRSNGELKVLFLESICADPTLIENNIRLKLSGPDYKNMDQDLALKDFVERLHNYERAYETIDEQEEKIPGFQYVKMIDVGKKVVSFNVQGFLASQTIYFLLNFNLCERQIWITRHGESIDNLSGRIGGDSRLTKRGHKFSKALTRFMNFQRQEFRKHQLEQFSNRLELKYNELVKRNDGKGSLEDEEEDPVSQIPTEPNFYVWTSMLTRAIETGEYFDDRVYSIKEMRMLNELGGGKFEGLTYEEIQQKYPKEYQARIQNKLTYRYPGVGGESYLDVLTRLRPLITEIERTTDHLLIISHRVVLRILLAYFLNLDRSSIGELDVPLHTLYCLESKPYGTDYRMYEYDESLDWFVKVAPEHQKNMKEVGVLYQQRKYSVIPTAPPSSAPSSSSTAANNRYRADVMSRRRSSQNNGMHSRSLRRSVSQGFKPSNNDLTQNEIKEEVSPKK